MRYDGTYQGIILTAEKRARAIARCERRTACKEAKVYRFLYRGAVAQVLEEL